MSFTIYVVSAILVFTFSGLLAMAGLGAAFLFVPMFYYLGVPLAEATPTALLLNVVSLLFATINYWRGKLINFRVGLPVLTRRGSTFLSRMGASICRAASNSPSLPLTIPSTRSPLSLSSTRPTPGPFFIPRASRSSPVTWSVRWRISVTYRRTRVHTSPGSMPAKRCTDWRARARIIA